MRFSSAAERRELCTTAMMRRDGRGAPAVVEQLLDECVDVETADLREGTLPNRDWAMSIFTYRR